VADIKENPSLFVERFADITLSDGITTDDSGNIYITDMENSAIHRVDPGGNLQTLFKDSKRLRWPDGFSFGPDGDLYVTESALHVIMMKSKKQIKGGRPYHIYRFKPGPRATPGH
jgi:sugar lactone lactonase YvrE